MKIINMDFHSSNLSLLNGKGVFRKDIFLEMVLEVTLLLRRLVFEQ